MRLNIRLCTLMFLLAASFFAAPVCMAGEPPVFGNHTCSAKGVDISTMQRIMADRPVGRRIAFWADYFVGTPYDPDPLGKYVREEKLVCDSEIDCMYHVFRSIELATSSSKEEASLRALVLRFKTTGVLKDGKVINYDERFQYGEDMIDSGKWGEDVTETLGAVEKLPGSRGRDFVTCLPKGEILKAEVYGKLKDGDIIFFIKDPSKRKVGEIVGHIGIIQVQDTGPMLIHASGTKGEAAGQGGGVVKKVDLIQYVTAMKFAGVKVTRFK